MRSTARHVVVCLLLICSLSVCAWSERVYGRVTSVLGKAITASFPTPVSPNSIMVILTGEGESVAGTAVSRRCAGTGPYEVSGGLLFVSDSLNLTAGKQIYVNSLDTLPAPSRIELPSSPVRRLRTPDHDLKLYYYAAGQTVGYGTIGLGYERTVRVTRGVGLEVDGGITAVGSVSGRSADVINTDQLIKSLGARVRFDCSDFCGFYGAYRWNQARGDEEHWAELVNQLRGKDFVAPSQFDSRQVMTQGLEYGITLRPMGTMSLSFGFIPQYRADYGTIGVRTAPGYTGELRFGTRHGALRLRGIKSEDYWQADLGVTIR